MVILDEINNAQKLKLVDLEQVLAMLEQKRPLMHLVLTGRDTHDSIIEQRTRNEIVEVRHAYRKDVEPQPGVDSNRPSLAPLGDMEG